MSSWWHSFNLTPVMITDTGQDTPLPLYALHPGPLLLQYDLLPFIVSP
jgi:hypothetical protein